jgi:DNA-binding transcriptional ArsR family regulator
MTSPVLSPTTELPIPAEPDGRELMARFYRALGDPTRLLLLAFCSGEERTGNECVSRVGLSQGRVSAHLSCLVSCGLLAMRREGRYAYYRVVDDRVASLIELGSAMVSDHTAGVAACTRVAPPA